MRSFIITTLLTSIWINACEVFRYFLIVRPAMRQELSDLDRVAEMSWPIFAVWSVWGTLLTGFLVASVWLIRPHFTVLLKVAIAAGTFVWIGFFFLYWVASWNMQLSSLKLAAKALPFTWIEMVVGALIASALLEGRNAFSSSTEDQ